MPFSFFNKKISATVVLLSALSALPAHAQTSSQINYAEVLSPVATTQSKIVLYRATQGEYAVMMPAYAYMDGQKLNALYKNNVSVYCVPAGAHQLGIHLEDALIYSDKNKKTVPVDLQAGQVYVYRVQDQVFEKYAAPQLTAVEQLKAEVPNAQIVGVQENQNVLQPCQPYVAPPPPPPPPVVEVAPPIEQPQQWQDVPMVDETPRRVHRGTIVRQVQLNADMLFGFNQSSIRGILPKGKARLSSVSRGLKGKNIKRVDVVAHTDRLGSENYNQKLSLARAQAIKTYLVSKSDVSPAKVKAVGKGERDPVKDCKQTEIKRLVACLQPNRRASIKVTVKR